jgi:hypothetical protein
MPHKTGAKGCIECAMLVVVQTDVVVTELALDLKIGEPSANAKLTHEPT